MPRAARIYAEEGVFHILARGNNKQKIFLSDSDFTAYRLLIKELRKDHPLKIYHYCFMTNHIHLVIETSPKTDLSRFMKRLNPVYYNHYKKRYGYAGHFWQDRFKSLLISRDEYLLACGLYIERNPVKAKMVESPGLYKYSSYNHYAYGQEDDLLDADPVYDGLASTEGGRQKIYRDIMLDKELGITEKTFKQLFLGTADFVSSMEKKLDIKNVRLSVGRPKEK